MLLLDDLLAKLNAAIEDWNRRVDARVVAGRLDHGSAASLKVRPGMASVDLVRADRWPDSFFNAVKGSYVQETPQTILELAKFAPNPSETIKQLCQGCELALRGKGRVAVRTLDLAHLLSRSAAV